MKKEIIFAIFLGLGLGLIITYGVYRARTTLQKPVAQEAEQIIEATPLASAETNLSITSPEDETITESQELTVAGSTNPNSFVVVIVNNQDNITTADQSGNFSVVITLETGSNVIQVHSIDEDGNTSIKEITVIYSTTNFLENENQEEATTSATQDDEN